MIGADEGECEKGRMGGERDKYRAGWARGFMHYMDPYLKGNFLVQKYNIFGGEDGSHGLLSHSQFKKSR